MPQIQVYKHNGNVVPVSHAKKTKAYQCPWTGKVISTKPAYVKYLQNLRKERTHARANEQRMKKLGEDLWNQSSFEKIINWIELHPEWFLRNATHNDDFYEKIVKDFSIKITYLRLDWLRSVNNSHHCPHNGVRNWDRNETYADGTPKPSGYPGWNGLIEYTLSHDLRHNIFDRTRICTGSGGSSNGYDFGYDVRFFADDWYGLRKGANLSLLANKTPRSLRYGDKNKHL